MIIRKQLRLFKYCTLKLRTQEEEFEDTKGAIRIRISKKNRQHNGLKKKYKRTNNDLQNIHIKLKNLQLGFRLRKKSKHNKSDMNNKRRQLLSELTYYRTPLYYYLIHYDGYSGPNYCAQIQISTLSVLLLTRYIFWRTIHLRGYHHPSSQCFNIDKAQYIH